MLFTEWIQRGARNFGVSLALAGLAAPTAMRAQASKGSPEVLDRVVAVVNNRAILSSDIADALRYAILDPTNGNNQRISPSRALQQLISRNLIEQQIRDDEAPAAQPTDAQVDARVAQLRRDLPVCVQENCASDAGWAAFLLVHGLTNAEVKQYVRLRMQILGFIETRFRQGIRISDQDAETYYREKLLPQYTNGSKAPSLAEVEPRIQEILLQQQVNVLFSSWLDSLRKQGDVEVLDPALESRADALDGSNDDQ